MDFSRKMTVLLCLSFWVQYGQTRVVKRQVEDVTQPMVTEQSMDDVATVIVNPEDSEEPSRAGFQGWNREQVLSYMSENDNDDSEAGDSADIVTEEDLKIRRIAEIQANILTALGITDPTSYSTPKLTDQQQLELISTLNRTQDSPDRSHTVKTFECMVAACEMPINQSNHVRNNANAKSMQIYFETNFSDNDRRITQGMLKLRLKDNVNNNGRRHSRNTGDSRVEIRVYRYLATKKANGRPRKVVVDARMVSRREERWALLNVRSAVRHWRRDPSKNYGLEIVVRNTNEQRLDANKLIVGLNCSYNETNVCVPAHSEQEVLGIPQTMPDSENNMAPNLHVITMANEFLVNLGRHRREADQSPCFKQPFSVSLSDLGWDNLKFTPSVIEAGVCMGNCTSEDLEDGVEYCSKCVPIKMGSVFLAYKDNRGNIGAGSVENLVVEECGLSDEM